MSRGSIGFAALLLLAQSALAQDASTDPNRLIPAQAANGLARTPPMGWNSWNRFGCDVNEETIRRTADALVASGMRDAGYVYVVIDDCWQGARDPQGVIAADAKRFPSGMKPLADHIHAKGLKFGLYSDAGRRTCGDRPGSQGHEYQDALSYAAWGVDYLKYDWCNTGPRNPEEAYSLMADALKASGRPIVFSLCEWGNSRPWLWARDIGNLWRTTGDIYDHWQGPRTYSLGMLDIVDRNEPLWPYAGPGHWNDPDMLEVGNGGMTDAEYRAHFSLWAMMAAPLIAGNDVATMAEATKAILLNREVIAVDQDALGVQGRRVRRDSDKEMWVKPLAGGARAILLLNRGAAPAEIAFTWDEIGYPARLKARIRDLWQHRDLPRRAGSFSATVESHGVAMLRIEGWVPAP
jgi:alpha-galactosidase